MMTKCFPVLSVPKVCPPCDNELKTDNIMEHYCASDFGKEIEKDKSAVQPHIMLTVLDFRHKLSLLVSMWRVACCKVYTSDELQNMKRFFFLQSKLCPKGVNPLTP